MVAPVSSSSPGIVGSLVGIGFGLVLLVVAASMAAQSWRFSQHALIAQGVVTRLEAGGSHPEIRFTTQAGEVVTYSQGGAVFGYRAGQPVRVRYDPTAPRARANVDTWLATWGVALGVALLGLMFLAGAGSSLSQALRSR